MSNNTSNNTSNNNDVNTQLQNYVDKRIKELKIDIIKYIDLKFRQQESKGKEVVLSNQNIKEVRQEIYSIIKKDVAPAIQKAVAFVDYKTQDGDSMINSYRAAEHQKGQKRITHKSSDPQKNNTLDGHDNPLHAKLFYFNGED